MTPSPTQSSAERSWYRLDNAALIYPSSMSRRWSAIFRLSAQLSEPVDPKILEAAVRVTIKRFPLIALRLRRGFFWYFLEEIDDVPPVLRDVANPCTPIDTKNEQGYLFRIRYHDNRIALEFFHVLTDGTGGLCFLKTLIAEYLTLRYGITIPRGGDILDCTESADPGETEDSFSKYARKATLPRNEMSAYHLRSPDDDAEHSLIIAGIIPADRIRDVAKRYNVTVTEYLVARLILAIRDVQKTEISRRRRNQKVKVAVPVNLRKYYPSKTLRNFSSFVNPGILPIYGEYTIEQAANRIKHLMGLDTDEKLINARFSKNVSDQRSNLIRLIPLFLKNPTLRIAHWMNGDRVSSTTLSNLGLVKLPDEIAPYVDRMDFILGPLRYNPVASACVTCNNKMVFTFTSTINSTAVQRNFFTALVKDGVPVRIESNRRY